MGGDEKSFREVKGERCWEKRARREEMMGSLLRARMMSGKMNRKMGSFGWDFDLTFIHKVLD